MMADVESEVVLINPYSAGRTIVPAALVPALLDSGFKLAGEEAARSAVPRGNASKAEWVAYASGLGIEVPDGAKASEIKALVAEHETEQGEHEQVEAEGATPEAEA